MADFKDQTLLVTGASGNLGRIAIEELLARGAKRIVAGTRDTAKLADLAAKGVEVRELDFDGDMSGAFAGVDRALIISTVAHNRIEQQTAAVAAAKAAGVKHLVYTSAPNARPNADAGGINDHYWTEQAIAASGLDFTFLRNHLYAEVSYMGVGAGLASGQIFDATHGGRRTYVTRADAARTAAGALLTGTGKEIHDVTGRDTITLAELVSWFSELTGKPLVAVGVTAEQLLAGLQAAGLPEFYARLLVAFDTDAAEGHHAIVTDAVERFSGRKPEALRTYLEANRAALAG
jgi:NAD(P)H dehydrogenase (quinone)